MSTHVGLDVAPGPDRTVVVCHRCKVEMQPGRALLNAWAGAADFPGQMGMELGCTISRTGPARLVKVWKCPSCGHSFTPDGEA